MRLGDLLMECTWEEVVGLRGLGDNELRPVQEGYFSGTDISGIEYDSRRVREDVLFVAIRGENFDGHNFVGDAIRRGAACIVHEKRITDERMPDGWTSGFRAQAPGLFFIRVKETRDALACISNNYYQSPSCDIPVIGITGTNGKTTTTYILKSILEAGNSHVGLIGTIGNIIKEREYPALHTTPEAPDLQRLLRDMVSSGCGYAVAEVSSHALSLKRVDYTEFRAAVFTNLTMDHLDFHKTMESYYEAKKRLFSELLAENGTAVINLDDEWGRRLFEEISDDKRHSIITYGINRDADVIALDIESSLSGISFNLRHGPESYNISSSLVGMPNVYNIIASATAAIALNIPGEQIIRGIKNALPVKGRMEGVNIGQDFLCLVDYAHTPDALERLISSVRDVTERQSILTEGLQHRIITVFGCGGNRDRGKRPVMGEIATRLSDYVIITSDNPRREKAMNIIREIESGIEKDNYVVMPDRRDAINAAVRTAGRGDVIIIAGKGHEDYQEIGDVRHRFSDIEVSREAIAGKLKGARPDES